MAIHLMAMITALFWCCWQVNDKAEFRSNIAGGALMGYTIMATPFVLFAVALRYLRRYNLTKSENNHQYIYQRLYNKSSS